MITSRRAFLKTAALGGASLIIGFDGRRLLQAGNASAVGLFKPNGWVCINSDGTVVVTIGKCEMGQGVRTSLAMILADELEADWTRIKLLQAKPSADSDLGTGGSDSMRQPKRKQHISQNVGNARFANEGHFFWRIFRCERVVKIPKRMIQGLKETLCCGNLALGRSALKMSPVVRQHCQ